MFFDKIRVSFFKRIAGNVELNFKPGINIISGDNNSGKSSLCEALTLATTGFVSGTLESKVSRESGEKKFLIDLLFQHENLYSLSIKAGIERTEKVLSNLEDETEIYETPSSVSHRMEQMIDPALTLYGSIALQHKTTSVIFDDPAPRLQKLKTILGLETLGKAVELIKKEQSEVKEKSVGLKSSLKTLESLTFDLKDEPDYSGDEDIETKYLASQEAYTDYLKSRESYAKAVASIDAERREYELLCQRYESALKEKLSIENIISAIQKDLDEITITSAEPLEPLIELRDSFKDEGTNLKRDIEDCVADLKRVEEGKCPTCGKPYDNLDPASLLQRKAELEAQKNKVAEKWNSLTVQIKALEKIHKELDQLKSRQTRALSDLAKEKSRLELLVIPEEPANLGWVYPSEPVFDQITHQRLKKEYESFQRYQRELATVVAFNAEQIKKQEENQKKIKASKKDLDKTQARLTVLDRSRSLLDKEFAAYLLEEGLKYVEQTMNKFFASFSNHRVYVRRDNKSVDFFFSLSGQDDDYLPAENLGGAYRQILAMAFRISLACLQKAEFMILDEVDSSASENISAMLFERAIKFAPSVKQWFIVTHKPETIAMLQREFETTVFEMSKGALVE